MTKAATVARAMNAPGATRAGGSAPRAAGPQRGRRGVVVVALVLVLAAFGLVAIGLMTASGDASGRAGLRAEAARAFYAGESAALIALVELSAGRSPPAAGTQLAVGDAGAVAVFIEVSDPGEAGEIVLEGRAGSATRRVGLYVE